ncbi:hypothetical protein, partial [Puniceibacterium confluentis]|uniref:hypothetical protein n=1 Tax=Puniceibacterium confluentis TaxID=1958944 RepID=UPI001FEA8784
PRQNRHAIDNEPDKPARHGQNEWELVPGRYTVLGTDGFGRSDSRVNLRRFFEVDANHIAAAAMVDLYREGTVSEKELQSALSKYDIDGGKPNPRLV